MIQVQIASTLEAHGVGDVRWVLIDPSDARVDEAAADHAPSAAAPTAPEPGAARGMVLRAAGAILLAAALAIAAWLAFGPAARP